MTIFKGIPSVCKCTFIPVVITVCSCSYITPLYRTRKRGKKEGGFGCCRAVVFGQQLSVQPPPTHLLRHMKAAAGAPKSAASSLAAFFLFFFCRSPQSIWLLEQNVNEPERRRRRGTRGEAVVNSRRSRVWRACACTYMLLLPSFLFFFFSTSRQKMECNTRCLTPSARPACRCTRRKKLISSRRRKEEAFGFTYAGFLSIFIYIVYASACARAR